jgi:SAM-dependent methyltransferase
MPNPPDLEKAALRGEPSYVWRAGQKRRLDMINRAAGDRVCGRVMEDGCGVGQYMKHMEESGGWVTGLDFDFDRVKDTLQLGLKAINAAGEHLPYSSNVFDLILSNEVIEHVQNDRMTVNEIVRTLKPGGRLVLFCPNRGYPYETHGIYWKGKYHFGNKFLVNYLPRSWRDRLAPHVRVYSRGDLEKLFAGLPVRIIQKTIIYGGYDNLVIRLGLLGKIIRATMQFLEHTPLRWFGLSHFWVVEKT